MISSESYGAETPLDAAGVERLRSEFGATGMLETLVELFGAQTPELVAAMRHGIIGGDVGAVKSNAHKLKGSCLTLAATRAAGLCATLEAQVNSGGVQGAAPLVDQVQAAADAAYAALRAEVLS
jgi:HPt (histidine-containing phosphotransfer) domain-containing protein